MIGPPNRQLYTKSVMKKAKKDMNKSSNPGEYSRVEKKAEKAAKDESLLDKLFFLSD